MTQFFQAKTIAMPAALRSFLILCLATLAPVAAAVPALSLEGTKAISLVDRDGGRHEIGSVTFAPADGGTAISVSLDETRFEEKFLSMRPFRCIDGTKQTVCHLVYPYKLQNRISENDLVDLEYSLLFLHKGPTDYGIDAWNGLYYRLKRNDDGSLTGTLHETDFNVLAVPPDEGITRPIPETEIVEAEEGRHRFPKIEIR